MLRLIFIVLTVSTVITQQLIENQCDFENDLCNWTHDLIWSESRWTHYENSVTKCDLCPAHPSNYLYVNSYTMNLNQTSSSSMKARLVHYEIGPQTSGYCILSLKYVAHGIGFGQLTLGTVIHGRRETSPILTIITSQSTDWNQIRVPLIMRRFFSPVIEARTPALTEDYQETGNLGFIAIDDVQFSDACNMSPVEPENSMATVVPPAAEARPGSLVDADEYRFDPQNCTDCEQHVERDQERTTIGNREQERGRLRTRQERPPEQTTEKTNDFDRDGERSVFEVQHEKTDENNCQNPRYYCNFQIDCEDASDELQCPSSCRLDNIYNQENFNQLCGWFQDSSDTDYASWIVITATQAKKYVDVYPSVDATTQTSIGKYLILKLGDVGSLQGVRLHSPKFYSSRMTCYFMFAYIIYDRAAQYYVVLNVDSEESRKSSIIEENSQILWSSGRQRLKDASDWSYGSIYIGQQSKPFRLTFIRSPGPVSEFGTIALDDLQFSSC